MVEGDPFYLKFCVGAKSPFYRSGNAVIAITIFGFFAPRISVKFGTAAIRGCLGILVKKYEKLPTFSPCRSEPLPDVGEIRGVYAGNRSTEVVNIWCYSVGKFEIYIQKTAMGLFPQHLRSLLAPKLLARLRKSRGCKNGTVILDLRANLVEIRRCTAA